MKMTTCEIVIKKKDLEISKLSSEKLELERRAAALTSKIQSLNNYINEYSTELYSPDQANIDLHRHSATCEFLGQLSSAKAKLTQALNDCNFKCDRIRKQIRSIYTEQTKYQKMADYREKETLIEDDRLDRKYNEELFLANYVRAHLGAK
jgi:flagellar export protein FliJ